MTRCFRPLAVGLLRTVRQPTLSPGRVLQVRVEGIKELFGGKEGLVLAALARDELGEVLGHASVLDGLDADPLEGFGELGDGRGVVEFTAVLESAGPGEDRRDRIGRGGVALLMLAENAL